MIFTSYFRSPSLRAFTGRRVAISVGVPPGWKGERMLELAPTRAMLKLSQQAYYRLYDGILDKCDVHEIARVAEGAVLLCWEKNPADCHRSYVAEWLREAGYDVLELEAGHAQASLGL